MTESTAPSTIALLPWGNVWEDYLDPLNISLENFCERGPGGWILGYVSALQEVGVRTVLFLVSHQVTQVQRRLHLPTGLTICILPAPKIYRPLHSRMSDPYGWTVNDTFGQVNGIFRFIAGPLRDLAPYLATPLTTLAQELKRERCSAIICQEYEYARFDVCVLLGKLLKLPVFGTFQGGRYQLSRIEQYVRPLTLKACAGLIVPSQIELERVQSEYKLAQEKIVQIFNPINLGLWQGENLTDQLKTRLQIRAELGIPVDAKVVIYHGRIEIYTKGLDVLMRAWAQVRADFSHQNWWLLLVGTGGDVTPLRDHINLIPNPNICWINQYILEQTVVRRYLYAADLYTLPSRHEGFPVAPLEAMACGLPVVAANAPGIADILADGEASGGIVVPRENPEALAKAIVRLLTDIDLQQQLSQAALQRIESCFSLKTVGFQLKEVLKRENHTVKT